MKYGLAPQPDQRSQTDRGSCELFRYGCVQIITLDVTRSGSSVRSNAICAPSCISCDVGVKVTQPSWLLVARASEVASCEGARRHQARWPSYAQLRMSGFLARKQFAHQRVCPLFQKHAPRTEESEDGNTNQ